MIAQKSDMEISNLKTLKVVDVIEQYQLKVSKRFAGLQKFDESRDIKNDLKNHDYSLKIWQILNIWKQTFYTDVEFGLSH
jgi:hypothetical protein